MKKGTFINYQLAEAILLTYNIINENDPQPEEFKTELEKLKNKWKDDIIPSTGTKVPDLFSMQDLTVKQLLMLSKELIEYDTYTIENCASMQNIMKQYLQLMQVDTYGMKHSIMQVYTVH